MKDFLGQILSVGDYVVMNGAGNRAAEYGSILYKIRDIHFDSAKMMRVRVSYNWNWPDGSKRKEVLIETRHNVYSFRKANRWIKVTPPKKMIKVFENPQDYPNLVSEWIHGQKEIDWS